MAGNKVWKHNKHVADYVRARIKKGATITSIAESAAAKFESAPTSARTFARVYEKDIRDARAELEDDIGEMVIHRAKESDKILELLARSRGNFNPTDKVAVAQADMEDLDEDSAVNDLLRMLGKDVDEEDT